MIETFLYYVLVDSISFQLQEVLCIWRILESYNTDTSRHYSFEKCIKLKAKF